MTLVGQMPDGQIDLVGIGLAEHGVDAHPVEHIVEHRRQGIRALAHDVSRGAIGIGDGAERGADLRQVRQKDLGAVYARIRRPQKVW